MKNTTTAAPIDNLKPIIQSLIKSASPPHSLKDSEPHLSDGAKLVIM